MGVDMTVDNNKTKVSRQGGNDCTNGDCAMCKAALDGLLPGILMRAYKGRSICMGIIQLPTTVADHEDVDLLKLDDPEGAWNGPGHLMTTEEFCTEIMQYEQNGDFTRLPLLSRDNNFPIKPQDMPAFARTKLVGLLDFRDKPSDFTDSQESEFDAKYPHRRGRLQVKAGDCVKVIAAGFTLPAELREEDPDSPLNMAAHTSHVSPFREKLWVQVISVTVFGMITGISSHELSYCKIRPQAGYLAFPVSAVVGMIRGGNWSTNA